jgi:DNA-binding response OmpR family regulator
VVNGGNLETGMQVLTKPFPMDELTRRIREMLATD